LVFLALWDVVILRIKLKSIICRIRRPAGLLLGAIVYSVFAFGNIDNGHVVDPFKRVEADIVQACEYLFTCPKPVTLTDTIRFWIDKKGFRFKVNIITSSWFRDEKAAIFMINDIKNKVKKLGGLTEWWIQPGVKPDNLVALLLNNGFVLGKTLSAMIYDLNDSNYNQALKPSIINSSISIKRFVDVSLIRSWDDILAASFNRPWPLTKKRLKVIESTLRAKAKSTFQKEYYAGYYHNQLAGTGCLLLIDGFAYLYNVATDPKFRRNGLATEMTKALLMRAKELGLHYVALVAEKGSIPEKIYTELGFNKVFDRDIYVLAAQK